MDDFDKINEERRRRGLPPLTRAQAQQARAEHRGSDDDFWHFAVAYATGFPMPSGMGVVGAMLSPNSVFSPHTPAHAAEPAPSYTPPAPDPAPSYSAPDPTPSYDSGSSGGGFDGGSSAAP